MLPGIFSEAYLYYLPEKRWQSLILFAVLILQYVVERLHPADRKNNALRQEGKNFMIGILNVLLLFFPSVLLVELLWWLKQNNMGFFNLLVVPPWLNLLMTFVIMDFMMYWWHRFNHIVPALWKFHRFHHLDPTMNTTTALRFHSIELLLSTIMRSVVYFFMGFNYYFILIYELIFFIVVLFHHANIRITKAFDMQYRRLLSSPLMHRIHHSNKQQETDTNYGSVFSFWDRLFGSYKPEAEGEIVFGVDDAKS